MASGTLVQFHAEEHSSASQIQATVDNASGAGDTFVLAIIFGDVTSTITAVLSSRSGTLALQTGPVVGVSTTSYTYLITGIGAGVTLIEFIFSDVVPDPKVCILEYSGMLLADAQALAANPASVFAVIPATFAAQKV